MAKEKVQLFTRVITDIKKPFQDTLTEKENLFWEKIESAKISLTGKETKTLAAESNPAKKEELMKKFYAARKSAFLYMNHDYRNLLMKGGLSEEDEAIVWEHGAKLAFQYANSGVKQKRLINSTFKTATVVCLALAGVCLGMDLYFNTYAKFRQLNLESLSVGAEKFELVPSEVLKVNGNKGLLSSESLPANAMQLNDYVAHIQKPNFKCGELESLSQSFRSNDGLPLCKENSLGDKYIVGYAKKVQFPEIVTTVIHEGKIYNLDLDRELGIVTLKIPGADTVTFDRVANSFAATFPDYVREYKANAVTKLRNK